MTGRPEGRGLFWDKNFQLCFGFFEGGNFADGKFLIVDRVKKDFILSTLWHNSDGYVCERTVTVGGKSGEVVREFKVDSG